MTDDIDFLDDPDELRMILSIAEEERDKAREERDEARDLVRLFTQDTITDAAYFAANDAVARWDAKKGGAS